MDTIYLFENAEDLEKNQKVLDYFISNSQSQDLTDQILAVKKITAHFMHKYDPEVDRLFIENFPQQLYDEFTRMMDGTTNTDLNIKDELFRAFRFIFRNQNLLNHDRSQSFVILFLNAIKTEDPDSPIYFFLYLNSISVCASHEPNKVLFINENGIFNIYNYCGTLLTADENKFWKMCQDVYTLDRDGSYLLSHIKITEGLTQILNKFSTTKRDVFAKLAIAVLRMVHRVRMMEEIEFNVMQFFEVARYKILEKSHKPSDVDFLMDLSNIWTCILDSSRNTFKIDTIDKLIIISAIFSLGIRFNIANSDNRYRPFRFTKHKKQRLYVIYLTLVAFPVIDRHTYQWLPGHLLKLHDSITYLFEEYSNDDICFEDKLLLVQYYIKSLVTLNITFKSIDGPLFHDFFASLLKSKLLGKIL
ncbi:hypothetical protein RF11_15629 [Thelohanellus kitauei]|uniref:Uncharacterized protein n=1 Tax=Thelohanellus kitauei TaxID=669202 RepID=A0A0C2NIR6_THEKT|nr:hypothetical protein RF11_15629 [Thelohanellus kitauei]